MNYHLDVYVFFLNNMDFEVLTLVFQVCLFVDHLTYNSIVCYCFDFLRWYYIIILNVLSFFFHFS